MGDSYAAFAYDNLEPFCTNRDVVNLGVAGMTAANWRLQMLSDAFLPPCLVEPDVSSIWLSLGGNDFMLQNCDVGAGFTATLTSNLNLTSRSCGCSPSLLALISCSPDVWIS